MTVSIVLILATIMQETGDNFRRFRKKIKDNLIKTVKWK